MIRNAFYIKRAFEMYDSGMYSLRSLTEKLYEEGFRNKTGKKAWQKCYWNIS